jgi:hypothetical protein
VLTVQIQKWFLAKCAGSRAEISLNIEILLIYWAVFWAVFACERPPKSAMVPRESASTPASGPGSAEVDLGFQVGA